MNLRQLLFYFSLFTFSLSAQDTGYRIEIQIDNYQEDTVFLGYRRGEKVYSRDTVGLNSEGMFVFEGDKELAPGIYLILMPPNNKFFHFILMPGDQHFSLQTKVPEFFKNQKFKGSKENHLIYDYQVFMNENVQLSKKIEQDLSASPHDKKKKRLEKQK